MVMKKNNIIELGCSAGSISKELEKAIESHFIVGCDISSSVLQFSEERGMRASFMVLVDGEVRFVRSAVTPRTGGIPIDLELEDTDRFLTLITAYEQVGMRNTSVFAEAALGLE